MLSKLESKIPFWQKKRRREIAKVKRTWYVLMKEYGEVLNREDEENNLLN
jgi:hypothetical protein